MTVIVDVKREAHEYMWACIKAVKTEIGGIGYIEQQEDGTLLWHKTLLTPQEVTTGGIDFTDDFFMVEQAHKDGVLGKDNFIWVWWHSHADMGVFWSSTDTNEYIAKFRDAGAPSLISIVGNRRGEFKMRLDIFGNPIIGHITLEDVKLRVEQDAELAKAVAADIEQYVTEKKPAPKQLPAGSRQAAPWWEDEAAWDAMQEASDDEWDAYLQSDAKSWPEWIELRDAAEALAVQG